MTREVTIPPKYDDVIYEQPLIHKKENPLWLKLVVFLIWHAFASTVYACKESGRPGDWIWLTIRLPPREAAIFSSYLLFLFLFDLYFYFFRLDLAHHKIASKRRCHIFFYDYRPHHLVELTAFFNIFFSF